MIETSAKLKFTKMKKQYRELWHLQTNPQNFVMARSRIYLFVISISFQFAYSSMMTTVDTKVINSLNEIYLNIIYRALLLIN